MHLPRFTIACMRRTINFWKKIIATKWSNLAGIVEHDVLTRELEQHGIVEELVDGDILGETFPPPEMNQWLNKKWFHPQSQTNKNTDPIDLYIHEKCQIQLLLKWSQKYSMCRYKGNMHHNAIKGQMNQHTYMFKCLLNVPGLDHELSG